MRYELSDFEWAAIKPFLPNKSRGRGKAMKRRTKAGGRAGKSASHKLPTLRRVATPPRRDPRSATTPTKQGSDGSSVSGMTYWSNRRLLLRCSALSPGRLPTYSRCSMPYWRGPSVSATQ